MGQSVSSSSPSSSYSSFVDEDSSASYSSAQQGLPSPDPYSREDENIHIPPCIVMTENSPPNDLELVEFALRRALRESSDDPSGESKDSKVIRGGRDRLLLLRLLNQVESLRAEKEAKALLPEENHLDASSSIYLDPKIEQGGHDLPTDEKNFKETRTEELMREVREVNRQNRITHWILGIMFVTTVIWRLSELTVALRVRENMRSPLKAIAGIFMNFFNKGSVTEFQGHKVPHLPHIQAPRLPQMEMPSIFQMEEISQSNSTSKPHPGSVGQTEDNKSVLDHIMQMQISNSHTSSHGNSRDSPHKIPAHLME